MEQNPFSFRGDNVEWKNGRVEEWKNSTIRQFDNGRVEEWKNSTIRQWKSGRMEEFDDSTMEEWKNGRVERFYHVGTEDIEETQRIKSGVLECWNFSISRNCSNVILHSADWFLSTAYFRFRQLPTANWRLLTASLLMPHAFFCLLPTGDCQLPHCHLLPHTSCLTPPFQLPTGVCLLPHSSCLMPHASRLLLLTAYCLLLAIDS